MIRYSLSIALVLSVVSLPGCTAQIHYVLEPVTSSTDISCPIAADTTGAAELVGVALSGGGSRAAVFGAATLEALWEHGLIDLISHVSSVSGGSIASSYFAANPPACDAHAPGSDQESCYRQYFKDFKLAMRSNYLIDMEKRQLTHIRWFSTTRRATSLQESIDDEFLNRTTFGDLADQRARAKAAGQNPPILLINASSFDDGRRFVFSNMCLPESAPPLTDDIEGNPLNEDATRALTFSRADCGQPAPRDMPVSLAVATSASFPGIGPVSVQVPSNCAGGAPEYLHLGDGGLFENSGIDTLEEVILREHRNSPRTLRRALLLSVASGKKSDDEELRGIRNFWLFSYHKELLVEAFNRRAGGYHDLLWQRLDKDLAAQGLAIDRITFEYTSAKVDRWPASCKQAKDQGQQGSDATKAAIAAELAGIKTSLRITDCNADLLDLAAHDVVHSGLDEETLARLRRSGFDLPAERIAH